MLAPLCFHGLLSEERASLAMFANRVTSNIICD